MLNILVTGGAGFIGSNFVKHILQSRPDCTVINVDKLTYAGNLDNLVDVNEQWAEKRHFFIKGDIADRAFIRSLFQKSKAPIPNFIVNFAAETHVDRSIMDASPFIEANIKGVSILLDAAREFSVPKFIHVSTDEVYGSLPLDTNDQFKEEDNLKPNSPYSASKAASDLLCKAYHKTFGLNVVITRCCNNYGCYQFPEKLIPLMTLNAMEDKPLPVYGDGKNVREWIHVSDHCSAIDFLFEHGAPGEVYNVGTGQEVENTRIVDTIVECVAKLRKLPAPQIKKLITFVKDRPGHDRRYALNTSKLLGLGWKPQINFEKGIKETVDWYFTNTDWSGKVRSGEYMEYYQKWYGRQ